MIVGFLLVAGMFFFLSSSRGDNPVISSLGPGELQVYVGGTGPGNYSSIQEALDSVAVGGTIFVYPGEYHENLEIRDAVIIQGESRENTLVDGGGVKDAIIQVLGGNATLQELTIQQNGASKVGILLNSSDNRILNCSIINHFYGVYAYTRENNTVRNCTFSQNTIGFFFDHSDNNCITGCLISHNDQGVLLYDSCNDNRITNCRISNNTEGLFFRDLSNDNIISQCNITHNGIGVRLWDAKKNLFFLNTFKDNTNHTESTISDNLWYTREKINYTLNGATYYGYVGNYWDDYQGKDKDGDGLGDQHYEIDPDDDDNFPIMPPGTTDGGLPGFELYVLIGVLGALVMIMGKHRHR
jgi:parallel beta-helix repeat protein